MFQAVEAKPRDTDDLVRVVQCVLETGTTDGWRRWIGMIRQC